MSDSHNSSNAATASVIVTDVAAPTALALAPASDSGVPSDDSTNVTTPTVTGDGYAGDTITLYAGTVDVGSGTVNASGLWSVASSALTAGTQSLTANQTDSAGNISNRSTALLVTIDTTIPAAPGLAFASSGSTTQSALQSIVTGTAEPGDTVTVVVGGAAVGTATADSTTGTWTYDFISDLASGLDLITATDTDFVGNVSAPSGTLASVINGTLDWAAAANGVFEQSGEWLYDATPTTAIPNATDAVHFDTGSNPRYVVAGNGVAADVELGAELVSYPGSVNGTVDPLQVNPGGALTVGSTITPPGTLMLAGGELAAPQTTGAVSVAARSAWRSTPSIRY